MDWQPIETAPKDGPPILIYDSGDSWSGIIEPEPVIYVCVWEGWNKCWVEADGEQYSVFKPTHWMPLPEPPVT